MFASPALAVAEIRRLGMPDVFVAVWENTLQTDPNVPDFLKWEMRSLSVRSRSIAEHVPWLAGILPLWVQNGEAIVGRLPDGRFVRVYYEDCGLPADSAIEVLGKNYQQFVTSILVGLADAGLWDE